MGYKGATGGSALYNYKTWVNTISLNAVKVPLIHPVLIFMANKLSL